MNIVAAKLMNDRDFRETLYEVPVNQVLSKDDIVIIKTDVGERFGVCMCDSFNISFGTPLEYLKLKFGVIGPLNYIIGKLNPERWD